MSQEKASADPVEDNVNNQSPNGENDVGAAADTENREGDSQGDGAPEQQSAEQSEEPSFEAQLEEANRKAEQHWDVVLRTRAEMDNLRKRQSRELENAHKYALDKFAMELLPVRDTLEMGVAAATEQADVAKIAEGTELTLKMLTQALEKFNIAEVDPVGQKFDPDLHQAISMQEGTDQPSNTVLNVMQKGYTLNERLLRPAMVIIAK